MPRTLLGQNVLVLLGSTLFALVLSLILIAVFVIRPEAQRAAHLTWSLAEVLAFSAERMNPPDRVALLQRINNQPYLNVKVRSTSPPEAAEPGSFAERVFLNALTAESTRSDAIDWRLGPDNLFWMRLPDDDGTLWVSLRTLQTPDRINVIATVLGASLLISVIGGLVLHRHLARPLRTLARQVEEVGTGTRLPTFAEEGPREVAAVARALNDMTGKMRVAEMDRSVMLAGVSHDLRTPLTKLRLTLAMLKGADLTLMMSADRQVAHIEAMLEQFLNYARDFAEEPLRRVDLHEVVAQAIADCDLPEPIAITCPTGLSANLKATAIQRAIANLVTNAQHYGSPPVSIQVRATPKTITIAVTDAGRGLSAEEADRLIRPFARGDTARTRTGTGLGLAIAHQVAQAHDGALTFSRSDHGFLVELTVRHE